MKKKKIKQTRNITKKEEANVEDMTGERKMRWNFILKSFDLITNIKTLILVQYQQQATGWAKQMVLKRN